MPHLDHILKNWQASITKVFDFKNFPSFLLLLYWQKSMPMSICHQICYQTLMHQILFSQLPPPHSYSVLCHQHCTILTSAITICHPHFISLFQLQYTFGYCHHIWNHIWQCVSPIITVCACVCWHHWRVWADATESIIDHNHHWSVWTLPLISLSFFSVSPWFSALEYCHPSTFSCHHKAWF